MARAAKRFKSDMEMDGQTIDGKRFDENGLSPVDAILLESAGSEEDSVFLGCVRLRRGSWSGLCFVNHPISGANQKTWTYSAFSRTRIETRYKLNIHKTLLYEDKMGAYSLITLQICAISIERNRSK